MGIVNQYQVRPIESGLLYRELGGWLIILHRRIIRMLGNTTRDLVLGRIILNELGNGELPYSERNIKYGRGMDSSRSEYGSVRGAKRRE